MPSQRTVCGTPGWTSPGAHCSIAAPSAARISSTRTLAGSEPPTTYESSASRCSPKNTFCRCASASITPAGGWTGRGSTVSGRREAGERVPSASASAIGPLTALSGTRASSDRRLAARGATDASSASPTPPRNRTSPTALSCRPRTRTSDPGRAAPPAPHERRQTKRLTRGAPLPYGFAVGSGAAGAAGAGAASTVGEVPPVGSWAAAGAPAKRPSTASVTAAQRAGAAVPADPFAARLVAARPVAARPVAAGPVVARRVAARPVAPGLVVARRVAARLVAARPLAAGLVVARRVATASGTDSVVRHGRATADRGMRSSRRPTGLADGLALLALPGGGAWTRPDDSDPPLRPPQDGLGWRMNRPEYTHGLAGTGTPAAAIMLRRRRAPRAARSMPMKTYVATPQDRERNWLLVDAEGQTLGRLATQIADALRGKRKPAYTPHIDVGDFVVVVNAEKISVTGAKLHEKMYYRHSGYPGGLKKRTLNDMLERRPEEVIRLAVRGMLPKNRLARKQLTKLKVYAGPEHPHEAQKPQKLEITTR